MRASRAGDRFIIEVIDDGGGIDPTLVRRRARERGVIGDDELAALPDDQVIDLIFSAGFSTATEVSDISGRGVGMDVVRYKIESLGGRLKIDTEPGRGTRFILSLPITTLQQTVMLFEWDGNPYGLPLGSLLRAGIAESWEMAKAGGDWQLMEERRPLPLLSLAKLFGGGDLTPAAQQPYLRIDHEGLSFALAASRVIGTAELLIKSLPAPINLLPGLSGAAILGDGRIAIMLDPEFIARGAAR
jgi:two-component system chemotaxis sensor kinase CheA